MSILVDHEIKAAIKHRDITIDPLKEGSIQTNSVDLHLGNHIRFYLYNGFIKVPDPLGLCEIPFTAFCLDPKKEPKTCIEEIPKEGMLLTRGGFYLGHTIEIAGSTRYVPILEGKSSIGRMGLQIHATAGFGDVGFIAQWTLEIIPAIDIIVYPGMPIAQIYFEKCATPDMPYNKKPSAHYNNQSGPTPYKPIIL